MLFFQVKRMFLSKTNKQTKKVATSVWKRKVFLQRTALRQNHTCLIDTPIYSRTTLKGKDLVSLGVFCCFIKDMNWNERVFAASTWWWARGHQVLWCFGFDARSGASRATQHHHGKLHTVRKANDDSLPSPNISPWGTWTCLGGASRAQGLHFRHHRLMLIVARPQSPD